MIKQACIATALLAVSLPSQAFSMRCGNNLISDRDTAVSVLTNCGEPLMKEDVYGRGLAPPKIGERWTYHLGKGKFTQIVTILHGKVVNIEDGPRG